MDRFVRLTGFSKYGLTLFMWRATLTALDNKYDRKRGNRMIALRIIAGIEYVKITSVCVE